MSVTATGVPVRVRVHPAPLSGTVEVSGDKSIGHRCLLVGSLIPGRVQVTGLAPSADIAATAAALRLLGVEVALTAAEDGRLFGTVDGTPAEVADVGPVEVDCGNSGTTLRLLAGVAAGSGRHVVLDGDASLRRRPVDRVRAPLAAMGIVTRAREDRLPPLEVLPGRVHEVDWASSVASAQIKSAVLLAAVAGGVPARIVSPLPSRDHTERMLTHVGIHVHSELGPQGEEIVRLVPGSPRATSLSAPRDPSAAAFWHVAAACGEGTVVTPGLSLNPGRTGALDVLTGMSADVVVSARTEVGGEPIGTVTVSGGELGASEIGGELVVRSLDELPVLALAGALSSGGMRVRDASELRVKESDRIRVLAETFHALGLQLTEHEDGFHVPGAQRPRGGRVDAHGDHRIAMTAAIAASLGTGPVDIDGFSAVGTSYPGFLADLERLGGAWESLDG